MTYIKWKDEVESYLIGVSAEEKKKVFSYFAEMYADKREAGESEEQIIEEFGAPYDVARRILEENKESAPPKNGNGQTVTGGSNYNYNYYNYNYGGAPAQPPPPAGDTYGGTAQRQEQQTQREQREQQTRPQPDAFDEGLKMPASGESRPKKSGHSAGEILLTILFVFLAICFVGSAVAVICDGFSYIASALGALAASKASAGEATLNIGYGLITVGIGFSLLAGATALIKCFKNALKKFKGEK